MCLSSKNKQKVLSKQPLEIPLQDFIFNFENNHNEKFRNEQGLFQGKCLHL